MWFAGAGLAFISFILFSGLIEFQFADEGEWEDGWMVEDDDGASPFAGLVYDDDDEIE